MRYLLILFILYSCSKPYDAINVTDQAISYDVAGQHYSHTGSLRTLNGYSVGVYCFKYSQGRHKCYVFRGVTDIDTKIEIVLTTDSLATTTYHAIYDGITQPTGDATYSSFNIEGIQQGYIDVAIKSYQNGIINGTFTGSPNITNGVIKNAQLSYW